MCWISFADLASCTQRSKARLSARFIVQDEWTMHSWQLLHVQYWELSCTEMPRQSADYAGLDLAVDSGIFWMRSCKLCTGDDGIVVRGEYGLSTILLSAGHNIATLMSRYSPGINWQDSKHWGCNDQAHPSRHGTYDGISMHPFETVFVKASWHVGQPHLDRYSNWLWKQAQVGLMLAEGVVWVWGGLLVARRDWSAMITIQSSVSEWLKKIAGVVIIALHAALYAIRNYHSPIRMCSQSLRKIADIANLTGESRDQRCKQDLVIESALPMFGQSKRYSFASFVFCRQQDAAVSAVC